jgi:nuclear pore complex protein Nup205
VDNPQALTKYYELLLAMLKVIVAIVLSQGQQNEQTISQARHFLEEYRSSIVSIFKRSAGIGSVGKNNRDVLEALVDNFTILISAAGFLDVC